MKIVLTTFIAIFALGLCNCADKPANGIIMAIIFAAFMICINLDKD